MVRFQGPPRIHASLRSLAAAERDCCEWAMWEVVGEGDYAVLQVTGPPGRIGRLAAAFGL